MNSEMIIITYFLLTSEHSLLQSKNGPDNFCWIYGHAKFSDELHSQMPPVLIFLAKTFRVIYTEANYPHSPHWEERSSIRTASSQVQLLWGTDSQEDVSSVITILTSSCPGSTVIYPRFHHNLSFPYKTTSISNHLPSAFYRVNFSVKIYSIGIAMSFVFTRLKRGHGFILVFYYRN